VSAIAVVGDDLLAIALARQLAVGPATVVLHSPARPTGSAADGVAALRLLHQDRHQVERDSTALRSWAALEEETGIDVLSPLHAIDTGPPATIAALLQATSLIAPIRTLYAREAARLWPAIRFAGLVAYQPAASRVSLAAAGQALLRSAASWGVQVVPGRVSRVRTDSRGDVQLLVDGRWRGYDAALVVADACGRSELAGLPTAPETGIVLSVEPLEPIRDWPSVVHHTGLAPGPGGSGLPTCRAEANDGLIDLTSADDRGGPDTVCRLWEYATQWLPGTIVGTKRVRSQSRSLPRLDTTAGRLTVTSPLSSADQGLAPVLAAELAGDLFTAVELDRAVARAS
jgi:hypothetical protein